MTSNLGDMRTKRGQQEAGSSNSSLCAVCVYPSFIPSYLYLYIVNTYHEPDAVLDAGKQQQTKETKFPVLREHPF